MTINGVGQVVPDGVGTYTFGASSATPLTLNGVGPANNFPVSFGGTLRSGGAAGTRTITNDIVLQSTSSVHVQAVGNTLNLTGNMSGAGGFIVTPLGTDGNQGMLNLSGANTYSGGTTINYGSVTASGTSGLGATTGTLAVNNANDTQAATNVVLNLSTTAATTTGSLSGFVSTPTSGVNTATINNGGQLFTVNQTAAASYAGAIAGTGGLTLGPLSTNSLTLTGGGSSNSWTGATTVSAGRLRFAGADLTNSPSVTINGGTLELAPAQTRVLRTPNLAISGTGKLDIGDNKVITQTAVGTATGGVYTDVTRFIQTGRGTGSWNGSTGIVTSQTVATSSNFHSIGIATGSEVKGIPFSSTATAVWAGQTVTGTDTLVMYTYGGDANLDGKINVDDYGRIDFAVPLGIAGWSNGDFNYDGKINVDDYGIIDFNVGIQGPPFPTAATGVSSAGLNALAVPEPAAITLLGLGAVGATIRRRRRRRADVR